MGKGKSGCGSPWNSDDPLRQGVLALGLPGVYEVGGCVRDRLLGREPKDVDIMVCGTGAEELLETCRQAGKAEPLVVADQLVGVRLWAPWAGREGVELALARTEHSTGSGHQAFAIAPIPVPDDLQARPLAERAGDPRLREQVQTDLRRRDFTCNAIACDLLSGELIDPLGGEADLAAGRLRVVGHESFRDDPLRILRGLARVAQDGLQPDAETARLAQQWCEEIQHLSGERIAGELQKILAGRGSAQALTLARDWGALTQMLPEFQASIGFDQQSRYHEMSVDQHILQVVVAADRLNLDPNIKLAALLHDIGKPATAKPGRDGRLHFYRLESEHPMHQSDPQRARSHEEVGAELAEQALERLCLPRTTIEQVRYLVRHHMFATERGFADRPLARQELLARRLLSQHGYERSRQLTLLRICDLAGKSSDEPASDYDRNARRLLEVLDEQRDQPVSISQLSVNGRDLAEMGLPPGPRTGEVLRDLLKIVVGQPSENDPQRLRRHAQRAVRKLVGAPA